VDLNAVGVHIKVISEEDAQGSPRRNELIPVDRKAKGRSSLKLRRR
jgi:hypothetical protein